MRKVLSIVYFDFKMQIRRAAAWGVLLAVLLIFLADSFPSAGNLARLEFLPDPSYFIHRILALGGPFLVFGLLFLVSNRFSVDEKSGVKPLMMAAPLERWQYILGKGLAGFWFVFTLLSTFLLVSVLIYAVALTVKLSPVEGFYKELFCSACKATVISVLPVSLFAGFFAAAFSALTDIRLFYLTAGVLFAVNIFHVGSAEAAPFYLVTSGDLIRLIWIHPRWPEIDARSVWANLAFLLAGGFCPWMLLMIKRRFWREVDNDEKIRVLEQNNYDQALGGPHQE